MVLTLKNKCGILGQRVRDLWKNCDNWAKVHSTMLFWLFGVLYKIVLDAVYVWAVNPQYAYAGMVLEPVSWKFLLSWIMYLTIFFLLPKREEEAIPFLLHLQFVYTVAPMLTFYAFANGSSKYILMVFICILIQVFMLKKPSLKENRIHIVGIRNYATVVLGILTAMAVVVPILYNGFAGLKAFDFEYIYEMRANATYPPGFSYLFNWVQKVIIPFALLCFIHKKKYVWSTICILLQTVFYMESGWKFTLLILFPIIAVYFLSKTGHLLKMMYWGLSAVLIFVLMCFLIDSCGSLSSIGNTLNALIPIRALFIPADIKFDFYECFQRLPHLYFRDGMIGKLFGLSNPFAGKREKRY